MPRRQVIERQERRATLALSQGVDPRMWFCGGPIDFTHNAPLDLALRVNEQGAGEDLDAKLLGPFAFGVRYQG
jgi:hypothetical protein